MVPAQVSSPAGTMTTWIYCCPVSLLETHIFATVIKLHTFTVQSTAHMWTNQKVRFHLANGLISITLTSWNPHQTRSVPCLKAQCFQEIFQQDPQRPPPHSSPFSTPTPTVENHSHFPKIFLPFHTSMLLHMLPPLPRNPLSPLHLACRPGLLLLFLPLHNTARIL